MAQRNVEIKVRLSEKEAATLKRDVKKAGVSREAYIRSLIRKMPLIERPSLDLLEVLKNLQQINNNMNQVATKANSLNFVDTAAYWENVEMLKDTIGKLLGVMYT